MVNLISKELNDLINEQIVEELRSAYIYLGMSAWAAKEGLPGLASFMKISGCLNCFLIFAIHTTMGGFDFLKGPRGMWCPFGITILSRLRFCLSIFCW